MLKVHESRERHLECLFSQVPIRGPCQLSVRQVGDLGHVDESEVARLAEDRSVHVAHQIRISRASPSGVAKDLRESGPRVDFDQDFRQLDPW